MLGALVESEAWAVLTGSLGQVVEQSQAGASLRGMSNQVIGERHLLTLLTMPLLGLFKPHHLHTYSGTTLGLLTGRGRPYSAGEMEHFILSGVRAGWVEPLTADVARWATQLWAADDSPVTGSPTYLYWDWHVKAVFSAYHLPRTKHGTSDRIVGARKQLMLHDAAGHLLFLRTYRGDTHLIEGMVDGTAYYEGLAESHALSHQIFDREGLSVIHFKDLLTDERGRQFITCLKSNQYQGVDSFELCTAFEPYRYDQQGKLMQEIAEAHYEMPDRRPGQEALRLRAILLRRPAEEGEEEGETRLFAIITPDQDTPASEIADLYRSRQSKQENAIRDWWLPLGGDVNVGYDKRLVENSELAKRKEELADRLERLKRYLPACEGRLERAQQRQQQHVERYQAEGAVARQAVRQGIQQREAQGDVAWDIYCWAKDEEARLEEQLEPLGVRIAAAAEKVEQEQEKQQRYRQEQQDKEQELAEVKQAMVEHPMYELDDSKDQLINALRLFLVNVLQWLRDTMFPTAYAHATYETLSPFLQMGGFVLEHPDHIEVRLDGYWSSAKQRDVEEVVAHCNTWQFTTPDGRPLRFSICPTPGHI